MRVQILILSAFAVAMAFAEAAAVVYLRELYYPNGFLIQSAADLVVIPARVLRIEMWREVATVAMLATVSMLAAQGWKKRLAAFVYAFSVWDVGYYGFLYLLLRWPPSLGTIDVYFLIPWPWVGPVWLPLLIFIVTGIVSFRGLYAQRGVREA